jgi:serine/threonine-protein kinase
MPANRQLLEQVAALVVPAGATTTHLGTGGYASTFKVVTAEGETYALKVVDAAQSGSERTDRELAALQRVNHPNVVGYLDTGTVLFGGVEYRWLKMVFVEGDTLYAVLGSGVTYDLPAAVGLVRQAVAGAAALWTEATAHRDLTPNNLMITPGGDLVIVDLGLARALDDETITTLPTPGTPGWMSPEQVGTNPTHGDWRSDQFVLGLNAYWLITGTLPFFHRTLYEAWLAPDQQRPRNPRDLNSAVPTALADLVMKMLAKQPHRRFLQSKVLIAELDRVAASLSIPETTLQVTPRFVLSIGDKKSFASEPGFLTALRPDGLLIEPRGRGRVGEFMNLSNPATSNRMVDPCTHLSRSPVEHRPDYFKQLPYGMDPVLTGFASAADRVDYCTTILDLQLPADPSTVLAPYFYAAASETFWIEESLRCATTTDELLEDRAQSRDGLIEPMWTTVAVAQSWLAQGAPRDELMTLLTSQPIQTLNLLIHTTQPTFGALADQNVLRGLTDVLAVMREAGVSVVLGRRASEGLLGLALGASGWTTGVSGVQMNMAPHPEDRAPGGRASDRIYVPQLFTHLTTPSYVQLAQAAPTRVALTTPQGQQLLAANPTLDTITTEQRLLLLQHNISAMRTQVADLADLGAAERIPQMRTWVKDARDAFRALPVPGGPGESSSFLAAWADVLN